MSDWTDTTSGNVLDVPDLVFEYYVREIGAKWAKRDAEILAGAEPTEYERRMAEIRDQAAKPMFSFEAADDFAAAAGLIASLTVRPPEIA